MENVEFLDISGTGDIVMAVVSDSIEGLFRVAAFGEAIDPKKHALRNDSKQPPFISSTSKKRMIFGKPPLFLIYSNNENQAS